MSYILKHRVSQNNLKPVKITQTTWETTQNNPNFQNCENLKFSGNSVF